MEDTGILDLRGLKCPLPALMARRRLARLAPGAELTVLADDPLAAVDIPHMCGEEGHVVIGVNKKDGHAAFEIRRAEASGSGDPAGGQGPA
jgi:tRNA 2-thiouridine synthesizing protein A